MVAVYHLPDSIIEEYQRGDSASAIAIRYSASSTTVLKRLKKYGVTIRQNQREPYSPDTSDLHRIIQLTCVTCGKLFPREYLYNKEVIQQKGHDLAFCSGSCAGKWHKKPKQLPDSIVEEYIGGDTSEIIAARYGVTATTVLKNLRRWGVPIRPRGGDFMKSESNPTRGKGHTVKAKEKMRIAAIRQFSQPGAKEEDAHRSSLAIMGGRIKTSSKLEDRVALELSRRGYAFQRQSAIFHPDTRRYCACVDFMLIDGTVIEVNGTFWHADPRKYPNGPIHDSQRKVAANYARKMEILARSNTTIIELWEMDLTADFMGTLDRILP